MTDDLYEQLKREATKKRKAALQRARKEYYDTVRQIDALRSRLGYEVAAGLPKRQRTMRELVLKVMPTDRAFTFTDIHKLLCELEPHREFKEISLRTMLRHMATEGILDRISKNQAGRVLWAVKGADIPADPFGSKSLMDVAEIILRDRGPLTPTELVVAVQEAGYRDDANPRRLVAALRSSVRRYPGRFNVNGGKWGASTEQSD